MRVVTGEICSGCGHFKKRMDDYPNVFEKATGGKLFPGTLNVRLDKSVPIKEHFRILGSDIGEPEQDLLFEICRINDIWAYRIRPLNLVNGSGGHGDHMVEIACSTELRNHSNFRDEIRIVFFGE